MASRSVVSVHIGHCGVRLGAQFWEQCTYEHGLSLSGAAPASADALVGTPTAYFAETKQGPFRPRAVLVDLDRDAYTTVKAGNTRALFPDAAWALPARACTEHTFAAGYDGAGQVVVAPAVDLIRRQVEACDSLSGLQTLAATGGAAGAGTATALLERLRDDMPKTPMMSVAVAATGAQVPAVEARNTLLALPSLSDLVDQVVWADNTSLCRLVTDTLRLPKVDAAFSTVNRLASYAIAGITCAQRLPCQGAGPRTLAQQVAMLSPFPRIHYLSASIAPLARAGGDTPAVVPVLDTVAAALLDPGHSLSGVDPRAGRCLTALAVFRGHLAAADVDARIAALRKTHAAAMSHWQGDNVVTSVTGVRAVGLPTSGVFLANSTRVTHSLQRIVDAAASATKRAGDGDADAGVAQALQHAKQLVDEYGVYETSTKRPDVAPASRRQRSSTRRRSSSSGRRRAGSKSKPTPSS